MHSRIYAARMDIAQKRMLAAVAKLHKSGLVDAPETLPIDRDPRITELLRMEYVADVLSQMAESVSGQQLFPIPLDKLGVSPEQEGGAIVAGVESGIVEDAKLTEDVNVGKADKAKAKK